MRKYLLKDFLSFLQSKPHLKRKLKVLAVCGLAAVVLLGSLTVYLGVLGARYVSGHAKQLNSVIQSQSSAITLDGLSAITLDGLSAVTQGKCLDTVLGLANLGTILGAPVGENIEKLRQACLPPPAAEEGVI